MDQHNSTFGTDDRSSVQLANLEGKYLAFSLGKEVYGCNITKISEILGIIPITPVPRTPDFVKGVVNLRGKIVPVIDLRQRFSMEEIGYNRETCIIVADVSRGDHQISVGMIVDTVLSVHDFNSANLSTVPEYGSSVDTSFIMGVGKPDTHYVVLVLDVDRLIGDGRFAITQSSLN